MTMRHYDRWTPAGAIIDLELAELEIEWAKSTSSWPEARRLHPARQSAIRTICRLQGMGPKAKDAVPLLLAALNEPELESYARSALGQIDPDVPKAMPNGANSGRTTDNAQPQTSPADKPIGP